MADAVEYNSGNDVYTGQMFVYLGDAPLAFATSAQLQISQDTKDASNKMSGSWDVLIPGKKSFQVTTDSLLTHKTGAASYETIAAAIIAGSTFSFWFGSITQTAGVTDKLAMIPAKDLTKPSFSGIIIPTECTIKSENNNLANCSGTFKGSGALGYTAAVTV
jgi:hypothetical protein